MLTVLIEQHLSQIFFTNNQNITMPLNINNKSYALCAEYSAAQQFLLLLETLGRSGTQRAQLSRPESFCYINSEIEMQLLKDESFKLLANVIHIFATIAPTLVFYALARLLMQFWSRTVNCRSWLRFCLEFAIITLPTILSINLLNQSVEWLCLISAVSLLVCMWRHNFWTLVQQRVFHMGRRPQSFTASRSIIVFHTCICILAVDFASFPTVFRKSRRYGAALMDVGIGLFVLSMAAVSKRPRRLADAWKMLRIVLPLLVLGILRVVVLKLINYQTDEHEYGLHLNAFTVLAFVKLFGFLFSCLARNKNHLLLIGTFILALHECLLQLGLSAYVMDETVKRDNFIAANREGLSSIIGLVALYLICMGLASWIITKGLQEYAEFMRRMYFQILLSLIFWLVTIVCIFTVRIARVTSNFGYVMWITSIGVSMNTLFVIIFDFILNTIYPLNATASALAAAPKASKQLREQTASLIESNYLLNSNPKPMEFAIPSFVEAINFNGLTLFMISNFLTGFVNIFLDPKNRTTLEGIGILWCYLLVGIGTVFALYYFKIRIA